MMYIFFEINIQRVGNSVDVVEVRNDLSRVVNDIVIPAHFAQRLNIFFCHIFGFSREFFCVGTKGLIFGRQSR